MFEKKKQQLNLINEKSEDSLANDFKRHYVKINLSEVANEAA